MKKLFGLIALLLMVSSPLALSAADHIVFIHGWQMLPDEEVDTWSKMVDCMTNSVYGTPYCSSDKVLVVQHGAMNFPIADIAANVWAQIENTGFPDGKKGKNLPKMDFVVHSMGGLVLRSMVAQGLLSDELIDHVVTLATPHYGQRFNWTTQQKNMTYGAEFLWELANAKKKISKGKVLSIVGTEDDVVQEMSAALCDEDCAAVRFVEKCHSFGSDGICKCGAGAWWWNKTPSRKDPVYQLVTSFCKNGTVHSAGALQGKCDGGAVFFQIVDGKDNPVSYEDDVIVEDVLDSSGDETGLFSVSPDNSRVKGIGAVVDMTNFMEQDIPVGRYQFKIRSSKDGSFSDFTTDFNKERIEVKKGRTTIKTIHAENVKPLDFVFLIDSTGSMDDDINSVKASARQLIQQKLCDGARNCRVAIADYRDYPESPYGSSGDYIFKLRCDFTTDAPTAINALNAISVGGGGDWEEAVLSALHTAIVGLKWDPNAAKTIMLMGDAGPHDPEPWSGGRTSLQVLNLAKERGVQISPMLTSYSASSFETYETYAAETGGRVVTSASYSSAAEAVQEVIEQSMAANGFETATVNVSETAGSVTVRVYGGNSASPSSVGYQVVAGSAVNGKDYSSPAVLQRLSWSAGERCYKTITIPISLDASSTADKFFSLILSDPVNMGLGGINVCRVNVLDRNSTGTPAANRVYVQGLSRQLDGGSVSGSGSYILGAEVTLQATAAPGYVFASWEDGSTSPTRKIDSRAALATAEDGVVTYVASFVKLSDLQLPEITSATSVSAKVGEAVNWSIDYYSSSAADVTCAGLPSGFTFSDGVVSGTAAEPGSWTATFTVSNAKGSVNASVTFAFEANPLFSGANGTVSGFASNGATEVEIPRGVTAIGADAFSGCTTLTSIKVPPTVASIGKRAFSGCTGLTVVMLPRTLEGRFDDSVFEGCSTSLSIQFYDVATVTFDANGVKLDDPVQKFAIGEPFGELPNLHVNRWKFLGWFATPEGGDAISDETIVLGNATYYAMWQADTESVDLGFYDAPGWEQPFFLSTTTNGLVHATEFEYGDPIYLRYAFMNVAGFPAVNNFVNRFTLNTGTHFDFEWGKLNEGEWGWCGMEFLPDMLQNLPVGVYTLTCVLDAEDFVDEIDEGNNMITVRFEVVPSTKPNLKIDSASVSRDNITLSESLVVHWRVDNDGLSAAKKTKTAFQTFKYDSASESWILKKTEWLDCNPLAAGAGCGYSRTVTGKSLGAGEYSFRVWADGKVAVREVSESDNHASTYRFTVSKDPSTRSTSSIDWQFKKLKSAEPDSFFLSTSSSLKKKATTFKVGQTIYMRRAFWNAKKKAVYGKVTSRYWLNGVYSESTTESSSIGANAIMYNSVKAAPFLQNLPAGKYTLTAVLDSENNYVETNEKNNIRTISFTVVGPPTIFAEATYTCALNESVSWPVSSEGTVTVAGLPKGLKYSGGVISGKATKTGTYSVKFTAKNAAGTKTKTVKIVVSNPGFNVSVDVRANGSTGPMSVSSGGTVPMFVGVVQNITVASAPGKDGIAKSAASSVAATGLPPGLTYKNGVISGVPSKTGTYTVKLVFKNALGWSKTFTMKMSVKALPSFASKTFDGWSMVDDRLKRKVSVSVTTAGKISAKVGSLAFSRTGWTVDASGAYVANMRTVRTTGSGAKKKTYTDVLALTLDPAAVWTEDQLTGYVATFNGNVSLSSALAAFETIRDEGMQALLDDGGLPVPSNEDVYVWVRRNPFGDTANKEAKAIANELASYGTQKFTDIYDTSWNIKVSTSGVATISRTYGSGKNKKTVSATAVVMWDGGENPPYAFFLAEGKVFGVNW